MPELSIIIVHHRTPGLLKLCLNSVAKTAAGLDYELVVVDSASDRQSRDLVKENWPEAKFLPFRENLGYARGVNAGIKNSSGRYLLILNPDVIVTEGAIAALLDFLKDHPDVGLAGPELLNFNGTFQQSYFSFYRPLTILIRRSFLAKFKPFRKLLADFLMADTNPDKTQTPDWIMGSALMASRQAIDKVGLMDERFFMYFEDVDWARRFWHNGFKVVYYPRAVMYHYHQRESKSERGILDAVFNQKTRWHIRSAVKFFLKYRNLVSPA